MEPDFRVRYRFFTESEGGRKSLPKQGYRCDFSYDEESSPLGIYIIWPEFLDSGERVLEDVYVPVQERGYANMYIVNPRLRKEVHHERIRVGTKGYFMEGNRKVAVLEVTSLLSISENLSCID